MSLIFSKKLATNASQLRAMNSQWEEVTMLRDRSNKDMQQFLQMAGNAAQTPAEAYREFDRITKIDQVPAGEFATLTRLMQKARSISLGREVFEYRQSTGGSNNDLAQSSLSGQLGVKMGHVDYSYAGTVVPIHDVGFGRRFREMQSMQAEGFDSTVDDSREAERTLMYQMNSYLWDGNSSISLKGRTWLGIKNDPSVVNATLAVDLSSSSSTPQEVRDEVRRIRDILYITNNCTNNLRLGVSREIASNWERVFSTAEGVYGTILDMILKLRGISEVYEDSELVGNQITLYWDDQQGFHPVVGMAMATYAVPRVHYNDDFNFIKAAAVGFLAKQDAAGRKCALYAD